MTDVATRKYDSELRTTLERERHRLRESLGWLESTERLLNQSQADDTRHGGDEVDLASDASELTTTVTIESIERHHLSEVEAALTKLADASYGTCDKCGDQIEPDRLVALPWTKICFRCSHRASSRHGRFDA